MFRQTSLLNLLLVMSICAACTKNQPSEGELRRDMSGFVLGDDNQAPKRLTVGVGESLDRFLARNPFLANVSPRGGDYVLNLPLMTRVDGFYDDGEVKFHVGCSFTTNIDGNHKHLGLNSVGFHLCDPPVHDWRAATRRTMDLAARFERENPGVVSLKDFRKTATLAEAEKLWETSLINKFNRVEYPLTEEQANRFFEMRAQEGHIEQLQFRQNTAIVMAAFLTQKAQVFFEVSKETYWGGDNLTDEQRKTMKYQIVVAFLQRNSTAVPCKLTPDWQRCVAN